MKIIKLLNKICAVNLSEPCRDDLKRLSDENYRLMCENALLMSVFLSIHKALEHGSQNDYERLFEIKLLVDGFKND